MFRETNTTGAARLDIHVGDGTNTYNHQLFGKGGNSYLVLTSGNLGVGTNAPTQKLDVDGTARIRNTSGTSVQALGRTADGTIVDHAGGGGGGSGVSWRRHNSNYVVENVNTAQNWFDAPAGITLEANSIYEFSGHLAYLSGSTSHAIQAGFDGTVGFSNILWQVRGRKGIANGVGTTWQGSGPRTTIDLINVVPANTNSGGNMMLSGTIRTTTAGTFIPQFAFSAAPGGTPQVYAGTFFKIEKIGESDDSASNW
jgi:hypothetical protein